MALAADQEAATCGFWPGSAKLPEPAFFAYTFPEPPGCREAVIQPDAAAYHLALGHVDCALEASDGTLQGPVVGRVLSFCSPGMPIL